MTPQEIQELFTETITKSRGLHNKVNDYSKDAFYNWRTGRTIPKISEMLSILYQLNLIFIYPEKISCNDCERELKGNDNKDELYLCIKCAENR